MRIISELIKRFCFIENVIINYLILCMINKKWNRMNMFTSYLTIDKGIIRKNEKL